MHIEESDCACSPKIEIEDGEMIFIHNSYDGRELLENILIEEELTYHQAHCTMPVCEKCMRPIEMWIKPKDQ